jgi:hypothetical protein
MCGRWSQRCVFSDDETRFCGQLFHLRKIEVFSHRRHCFEPIMGLTRRQLAKSNLNRPRG